MQVENMTRTEMETEILMNDILPANSPDDLSKLSAMSDDEMRAAIVAWVAAGDECATA